MCPAVKIRVQHEGEAYAFRIGSVSWTMMAVLRCVQHCKLLMIRVSYVSYPGHSVALKRPAGIIYCWHRTAWTIPTRLYIWVSQPSHQVPDLNPCGSIHSQTNHTTCQRSLCGMPASCATMPLLIGGSCMFPLKQGTGTGQISTSRHMRNGNGKHGVEMRYCAIIFSRSDIHVSASWRSPPFFLP